MSTGGFTLPGQAGYEKLTLDLAKKWGADCIRDSDGTQLSPEILGAGIPIYSTLCLIRTIKCGCPRRKAVPPVHGILPRRAVGRKYPCTTTR
jgi:hypothetical protein